LNKFDLTDGWMDGWMINVFFFFFYDGCAVHATTVEGTNRRDFGHAPNQQQQQQHAAQQHQKQPIAIQRPHPEAAAHH
jgi:hypothetical protein